MKKILSLGLAVTMAMAAMPAAYAADYTQGTQVEYIADADANREYTITVPALLNPGQSGAVTLKGKWASNETVKVTADATVELTNSINSNDKKVLNIGFNGIEKAGDNTVERTYTENVSVAAMPSDALFGTWSGKFNYNVEFDDGIAPTVMFYDVKYYDTDPEREGQWLMFNSTDGKITGGHDITNPDGVMMGTYTTKGQKVIATGFFTDENCYFSADGYTFTTAYSDGSGSTYVYTP